MAKTQSLKPASHIKLDAKLEARVSTKREGQALPQRRNARLEARVSTTEEPLRLYYNCPHYRVNYCPRNEGVNPHYGGFLGDSFTL